MNFEHATEYGPHIPDKEQVLKVFEDFGLDAEESKVAMGLWIGERFRLADCGVDSPKNILVNIEIADLFLDAGDIDSAVDNYDVVSDILEVNPNLSDDERDFLRAENEKLGDRIDACIN